MLISAIKKALLIFLAAVTILTAVVILAPNLLQIKALKGKVTARLRHDLHSQVAMGAIQWRWLPTPHVVIHDLGIDNDQFEASLPIADFYPDWLSFLPSNPLGLRSVVLTEPQLRLKKIGSHSATRLPTLTVKIKNGSISTPAINAGESKNVPSFNFTAIDATMDTSPESFSLQISGIAPFVKKISMQGQIDLKTLHYQGEVDCQGLILRKGSILSARADNNLAAIDSVLSLKSSISGEGKKNFNWNIIGDMPCLLYQSKGKKTPINCGFGDFTISKEGETLSLKINELEVREPALALHGMVSRTPKDGDADQWHIDLTAKKLDLAAIRAGVLNLLPQNKIAALVCNIVRSGEANSGSFKFDGPLTDLAHLRKMTIAADVKSAEIHVPHAELDLFDASGPILIKNGVLSGKGLSAKLGNSVGRNGVLLVGLAHDHFGLELDLDIDADLVDISTALKQQVHHQPFQKELARFSNPAGKASGHLTIGDHQHHVEVAVSVKEMQGTFHYDRSPWPITVHGGRLEVDTDKGLLSWHRIAADLGPQRISQSDGSVLWGKGPTKLTIKDIEAHLDAASLYEGLNYYPALRRHIEPVLTAIDGPITLNPGSTFSGPFFDPPQWQYSLAISTNDLRWHSPLLPEEVITHTATAIWRDTNLQLFDSDNSMASHSLQARGNIHHHLLHSWFGFVDLSGEIGEETGNWIKEKGWLPPSLLPRTPAQIDRLRLTWNHENLLLTGMMHVGRKGSLQPAMAFDLSSRVDNPLTINLDFTYDDEKGHLTLDLLDKKPETFSLEWHGILSGSTISALMADKDLLTGDLQGDFKMTVPDPSTDSEFEGWLRADNFSWYWGEKTEFINLRTLSLIGNEDELLISNLDLDFADGESLSTHGSITPEIDGLMVDLNLTSPRFSQATINDFLDDLNMLKAMQIEACEGNSSDWSIIGTMDFNIDHFLSEGRQETTTTDKKFLHWQPLIGRVELYPDQETRVEINTANLCCLGINGVWNSPRTRDNSSFNLSTSCDPLPLFQDVLPCLGIDQDVIEGSFKVIGKIQGTKKKWQNGRLVIHSEQGRILRMTLLSKIFSVVNLTDLFTTDELPDLEKEGFPYSYLDFEAKVKDNRLIINNAKIRGKGLNLFGRGEMDLTTFETDFTVMIAPFKTIDTIISHIPVLGRVIGGKNATLITIPVKVTGPFNNPNVVPLAPSAIGEGFLNIVKETLLLPFTILSPLLPNEKKEGE